MAESAVLDARSRMDRMYRHQRYIYDLTRKFYLLGRDDLLGDLARDLAGRGGARICEIGCGTGRNLVRLGRRLPMARLYGIDVSPMMLGTARRTVIRAGLEHRISLAEAEAQHFDASALFGVERFDAVYFSYVLSMLPEWRPAVTRALALLHPRGLLGVVDFADQAAAPPLRRQLLLAWLALFGVHPRAEIESELILLAQTTGAAVERHTIGRGYAYRMMLRRADHHAP